MLPDDMRHLINYDEKIIWTLRANETVVVSNQRLIIRKSGGLGLRKSFVDYPYSNMVNVQLDKGLRRSSVEISMRSGVQTVRIRGMSNKDAYQLHRIVRENIIRSSEAGGSTPFPVIITPKTKTENGSFDQKCRMCGHNIAADYSLCPFCGYTLKVECPECGKQFDRKYKICPYCGEHLALSEDMDIDVSSED
jgi:RNA polymerase subunit RPABC4/transcription elongation factor Spt4